MSDRFDLAVLGAGPAGLGAARRAAARGLRVVVVERDDWVGGAAASFSVDGLRVDHGSHRLHRTISPAVLADLESLLGDDLQVRRRKGRIRLRGRWLGFPLSVGDVARSLPPAFAARAARDAVAAPLRRKPRRDTFAEVSRSMLGPTMADGFYAPYARKLWGLDPEDLSGEQARRRISATSLVAVARRMLGSGDGEAATFRYPRRGFGQIADALAAAAVADGADLRLGATVTSVSRSGGDDIEVATSDGSVTAGLVLSTVALPLLARLWQDTPPAVLDAASRLRSRAMVLVYLTLESPRYSAFDAHYFPEEFTPVTRISEPKNYRDSDEDPAELTVLCAEVPCERGDDIWSADDDTLGLIVVDALREAGLPQRAVRGVTSRRLVSAYPVYRFGYERHLDQVERWAESLSGVLTFGRQGLFVHDNTHHALTMAWAASDAVREDGSLDRERWQRARDSFRSHVVED